MTISSFLYLAKQGLVPGKGNRFMSFASIVVLASCLIITGIAVLLSTNLNSMVESMGEQNEIIVFLQDDLTQEQVDAFGVALSNLPNINYDETVYTSKEQALEEQISYMGDMGLLLEGYKVENNPFPASFRVKIFELESLEDTTEKISEIPGIDYISSPTDIVNVILGVDRTVTIGGWGLVGVLAMVSLVVISNTIRLTVFARRKEINIMKYVGATNTFIRFPFFVEGVFIGLIASLSAFGIISGAYLLLLDNINTTGLAFLSLLMPSIVPYGDVAIILLLGFVIGGVLVGVIGSQISVSKHLKV